MNYTFILKCILLLFIINSSTAYDYIIDYPTFFYSGCTLAGDDQVTSLGGWKGVSKTDFTTASNFHLYGSAYAGLPSQSLTRCWADVTNNICVYRTIPQLPAGDYNIKAKAYLYIDCGTQVVPTPTYNLTFYIRNSAGTSQYSKMWTYTSDAQLKTLDQQFTLSQKVQNARIMFCGDSSSPSWIFSNVELISATLPTCASGAPYDQINNKCPTTAQSVIPNCQIALSQGNNQYSCSVCSFNYLKDSTGKCIKQTYYCSNYKNGQCYQCINGFYLVNGACLKQSNQCLKTDSNGYCVSCSQGYTVNNYKCEKNTNQQTTQILCKQGQYLDSQNICVNGNVTNCKNYAPSGLCQQCKQNFKLTSTKNCTQQCPQSNQFARYFFRNDRCIMTDPNCFEPTETGACSLCDSGYFNFQGKCYPIVNIANNTESTTNNENSNNDVKSDGNYIYFDNSDGSRTYLSGPWSSVIIWVDQRGYYYEKIAQEGRIYMTGPQKGLKSYRDDQGNWYAINSRYQRQYFTGPQATTNTLIKSLIFSNSDGGL